MATAKDETVVRLLEKALIFIIIYGMYDKFFEMQPKNALEDLDIYRRVGLQVTDASSAPTKHILKVHTTMKIEKRD
ncbi:unnamed protein product [Trifolium pratense]|uniref:Uncharacterized protein n=1 Tax=Trifolium pratense TaxID=57577 RepID=A0ACB0JQH2_TRIPR|nr:unnamed protein product [Trifolium pratense]